MKLKILQSVVFIFVLLVLRKIFIGCYAMLTVYSHKHEVSADRLNASVEFDKAVSRMDNNTIILFLNKFALNMTLNWLCNTKDFPDVHEKSFFICLDEESSKAIQQSYPSTNVIPFHVQALQEPFNYADGRYQLFYLLRSNVAHFLLSKGVSFWMAQQDTVWRKTIFDLPLNQYPLNSSDVIFDSAGEDSGSLIAGGYYYARSNLRSQRFFEKLSRDLSWWYAPDNAYMTYLCSSTDVNCGNMPFRWIVNWQWFTDTVKDFTPSLIQFDGYTQLGGKLQKMKELGFFFQSNGTCSSERVQGILNNISNKAHNPSPTGSKPQEFAVYQQIINWMTSNPLGLLFLNRFVYPYAHFCMLSM